MDRLRFEESWRWLQQNTNLVGSDEAPPHKIGPAGFDGPESWIDYYKYPALHDEEGVWRLENLTMPGVCFCRCGIYTLSFRNTSLTESSFCWNDFIDVDFTDADLSRCDLRSSIFKNVPFVRADLRDADLRRSCFENCDFTDADMTGTKMTRAQAQALSLSEKQRQEIAWKRSSGKAPQGG